MRVTSIENSHIINKTKATFDSYWNSEDFEAIDTEERLIAFEKAIREQHGQGSRDSEETQYLIRFERKTHQIKVLEKLQFERSQIKSYKNLVIAATGTGKTAISAFDFKDYNKIIQRTKNRRARI